MSQRPDQFKIGDRTVGENYPPLVIAEIGINHEGNIEKALRMVDDAIEAGCECVKFQSHVIEDEMIPNDVIPGNTTETIWQIMQRCALTTKEEIEIKEYVEKNLVNCFFVGILCIYDLLLFIFPLK